jgi:23S rRNA (uridine2552-2'-O)-methyltransferase
MVRRTGSSRRWLNRQARDPYVERATLEGWRSRAAFKLIEIDQREHILKSGGIVVDLGRASQAGERGRQGPHPCF